MSVKTATALAHTLADQFANQAAWTDRGETKGNSAIGQVARAIDPAFEAEKEAVIAELEQVISQELAHKLSNFLGNLMAHHEDGGYLFGLAIGQRLKIPALAPNRLTDDERAEVEKESGAR